MIKLMLLRKGELFELPTSNITWSGQKLAAPRTVQATIFSTSKGLQQKTPVDIGDRLILMDDNTELFRGIIEQKVNSNQATIELIAYDSLYYLTRNRDTYNFKNQTLSQVVKRLANDFKIPLGSIADSGTSITRIFENQTLFDIILTYINLTFKKTGVRYTIYDVQGRLCLSKMVDRTSQWVIEQGTNLITYRYTSSIAETITRVKLQATVTTEVPKVGKQPAKKTTKTLIAKVDSPDLQKRFGILQAYEMSTDQTNQAKLLAQAKQMLAEKGRIGEEFEMDALGQVEVVSGSSVYVAIPELGVKRGFYVDSDVHTITGASHTMSLTLNKSNEMPEIDASSKDESDEDKEKKANSKKKSKKKSKNKKEKDTFYDDLMTDLLK